MLTSARLHRFVLLRLLDEARREPHLECCGLLAGRQGVISEVLPARNSLRSATAYEIAPRELFALFHRMREQHLDHLGIYHSHPHTDNAPSPSDLRLACYPTTPYFIISPREGVSSPVRAFQISGGHARELVLDLV